MYAFVTCCPDTEYSFCCLSKFSICPSELHFTFLKGVAIYYLTRTKYVGIRYHRQAPTQHTSLDPCCFKDEPLFLPDGYRFFSDHPAKPNHICYVDTAYENDLLKRCSTT